MLNQIKFFNYAKIIITECSRANLCMVEFRAVEVRAVEVRADEVRSAEVRIAEVGLNFRILFSPGIPFIYASLESRNIFIIRHAIHL